MCDSCFMKIWAMAKKKKKKKSIFWCPRDFWPLEVLSFCEFMKNLKKFSEEITEIFGSQGQNNVLCSHLTLDCKNLCSSLSPGKCWHSICKSSLKVTPSRHRNITSIVSVTPFASCCWEISLLAGCASNSHMSQISWAVTSPNNLRVIIWHWYHHGICFY